MTGRLMTGRSIVGATFFTVTIAVCVTPVPRSSSCGVNVTPKLSCNVAVGSSSVNLHLYEPSPVAELNTVAQFNTALAMLERSEKNIILTNDRAAIKKYDQEITDRRAKVQALRKALGEHADSQVQSALQQFDDQWQVWMPLQEQIRQLSDEDTPASNTKAGQISMGAGKDAINKIHAAADQILTSTHDELERVDKDTDAQYASARTLLIAAATSLATVLAASLLPALRASRLAPIEALREE